MTLKTRAWARPLLAAGVAAATLTAATPGAAQAAQPPSFQTAQPRSVQALALASEASYEEKLAVAVMFGRGNDSALLELADRDFVVAIWNHVSGDPDRAEVRLAAVAAFSAEPSTIEQACHQFIVTGVFAAVSRDVARKQREVEAKRASDLARSAAAASISVVADAALLNGTDADFVLLILERVAGDVKWPKVTAAARAARAGSDQSRQQFIASAMAEAAKRDTEDRIAADLAKTEAEKAAARSRAAKKLAADRVGLAVTEGMLNLSDRDFLIQIWTNTPDGSEVQIAARAAYRSLDPAVWKAFIDTGIHQAKDRDGKIAADKKEAEERSLVQGILTRAEQAGQRGLAAAARTALAGNAAVVTNFLWVGQFQIGPDVAQLALTTTRVGMLTANGTAYVNEGGLDGHFFNENTDIKQIAVSGNRIGVLTNAGVALVKEGDLHAQWITQQVNVKQLALDGNRIGVLLTDGSSWVKEGRWDAEWVAQANGISQIALSGNRIGVLRPDGLAWVKEGALGPIPWVNVHSAVTQMVLSGNRIGVLRSDGNASVKEGALGAGWVGQSGAVNQIVLSGNRIGVLLTDGNAWVKEGAPDSGGWLLEHTAVTQIALSSNRVGILRADGSGLVKEGDLSAVWRQARTSSDAVSLPTTRVALSSTARSAGSTPAPSPHRGPGTAPQPPLPERPSGSEQSATSAATPTPTPTATP